MFKTLRIVHPYLLASILVLPACDKGTGEEENTTEREDSGKDSSGKDSDTAGDDDTTGGSTTDDDETMTPAEKVAAGRTLFDSKCSGCHGDNGEGGASGKPKNLAGAPAKDMTDGEITDVITEGGNGMPGFSSLDEGELESLVAFIRCLQTEDDPADCA